MSRALRLTQRKIDAAADRVRARLRDLPEPITALCIAVDPRCGSHSAIRVLDSLRGVQKAQEKALGKRVPVVMILDVVGRTGVLNRRQESAFGLLIMAVVEWIFELHYPTGSARCPLMAIQNPGWKREGEIPQIEWSLVSRDFFREDGEPIVPRDVNGYEEAWGALKKRCPLVKPIEHADAGLIRRHERSSR